MPIVSAEKLKSYVSDMFVAAGVIGREAKLVAQSLVDSNLCGHDSHGVVRVMEYVELLAAGELKSDVQLLPIVETAAAFVGDAQFGFGQVQMRSLIDKLVPKAKSMGVAVGTLKNCGHIGRLGEWAQSLADSGLASWLTCNDNGVLKCVAPPGGTQPTISTNPLAIGVPTKSGSMVVDLSTSQVANGKIKVAQLNDELCPDGWLLDADGNATNDPNVRFNDPLGSILPMGGYKGFGLGLLLDMLVGGLSGGSCPPACSDAVECNNALMIVFSPDGFSGSDHFLRQVQELIDFARSSPTAAKSDAIRLPNDRSLATRADRLNNGVPVDNGTWLALAELSNRLGIPVPEL